MILPFIPENPSGLELTLLACAIGGSLFFLLRVAMVLIGGFADDFDTVGAHDTLGAHHGHTNFDDTAGDAHHTEAAFKLVSLNTISAFIMMFGWAGLTAKLQFNLGIPASVLIALTVGITAMVVTALLYMWALRLASPGADFHIAETIGKSGSVYQEIPAEGMGKIQISINGFIRELQARCDTSEAVPSFSNVLVTGTLDNETVVVKRVDNN
ncbi:MAG: hypothetical protein KDD70_00520 [Bdellovibrionales bacterium]|nr:hypothetical protein [Bdellovibrionales bacterium]